MIEPLSAAHNRAADSSTVVDSGSDAPSCTCTGLVSSYRFSDTTNPVTLQLLDSRGAALASYNLSLAPFSQTAIDLSTLSPFTSRPTRLSA